MSLRFDGDLSQRSTWTKRWRLRYFAIADATLALWESEAAATAPLEGSSGTDAEVNPPVSSLRLSDRLSVIIVNEPDEIYVSDANASGGPGLSDWEDAHFSRTARGEALSVSATIAPLTSSASARRLLRQRSRRDPGMAGSSSPDLLQAARADDAADAAAQPGIESSPGAASPLLAPTGPACGLSTASLRYAASLLRDNYGLPLFTSSDSGAAAAGTLDVGSPGLASSGRSSAPSPSLSVSAPVSLQSPPRPGTGVGSAPVTAAAGDGSSGGTSSTGETLDAASLPHVLVLAHLPRSSGAGAAAAGSSAAASASSAPPSPVTGPVTGAGAGLREALVLAAPDRAELQLWAFVLRALCAPGGPRPLPPHVAGIIASRNERKQASRKLAGLLAMPSLPIVLSLPTPSGFTPASSPLPAPPAFPASPARTAAASVPKPSAFSSGSGLGLVRRPNAVAATPAPASAEQGPLAAAVSDAQSASDAASDASSAGAAGQSPPAARPQLHVDAEPAGAPSSAEAPSSAATGAARADASSAVIEADAHASLTDKQRWECAADGPERLAMRESVLSLLLARAPVASATAGRLVRAASNVGDGGALAEAADAALASIASGVATSSGPASGVSGEVPATHLAHLRSVLVPKLEEGLYEAAAGDRAAYVDKVTLRGRLRAVMAGMRAAGGGGAPPLPPAAAATAVAAAAAPTLAAAAALAAGGESASIAASRGAASMPAETVAKAAAENDAPVLAAPAVAAAASPDAAAESAARTAPEPEPEPKPAPGPASVSAAPISIVLAPVQAQAELVQRYGGPRGKPHPWTDPSSPYHLAGHTIRHYPPPDSFDDDITGGQGRRAMPGSLHLCLVLDRRPPHPPHLPTLNKWQHRRCAGCGVGQTTGMFGTKAHYCHYTELLFCSACMTPPPQSAAAAAAASLEQGPGGTGSGPGRAPRSSLFAGAGAPIAGPGALSNGMRPIPWRVVHQLDDAPLAVCRAAAGFIDRLWTAPLVALSAVAPATLARVPVLQRIVQLRARLADAIEAVVTAAEAGDAGSGAPTAGLALRSFRGTGSGGAGGVGGGSAAGGWAGSASASAAGDGHDDDDEDGDTASIDLDGSASASSSFYGAARAAAGGDGDGDGDGEGDNGASRLVVLPPAPPASVAGSATGAGAGGSRRRPHPASASGSASASASFRGKPPASAQGPSAAMSASASSYNLERALARAASQGFFPSEALSPTDAAAARSAAAAVLHDRLLRAARSQLGAGLSFMAQSVELLPLALIVPLATSRSTSSKALARLAAAIGAVHAAAEAAGYGHLVAKLLSPGASPGPAASDHAAPGANDAAADSATDIPSTTRTLDGAVTVISTASTLQPSVASRTAAADVAAAAQTLSFAGAAGTPVAARPAAAYDDRQHASDGVDWSRPLDDGLGEHRVDSEAQSASVATVMPDREPAAEIGAVGPASPPGHPYMRFAASAAARADGGAAEEHGSAF